MPIPKLTEEEKKQRNRERCAKWRAEHKKELAEYNAKYRAEHPDYDAKWYQTHKEQRAEYNAKSYQKHREKRMEYEKEYKKTPMGRAVRIVSGYKTEDKKYNRGECTLTSKWVVENIFNKPCHYCGKEGWDVIGCDRIDNSLPHTPENVVPCCKDCNLKRQKKNYEEFKLDTLWHLEQ